MGQPGAVLPESLDESSHSSATTTPAIASADDLLAQLAGEEIDRLLAENEAEQAANIAVRHADQILATGLASEAPLPSAATIMSPASAEPPRPIEPPLVRPRDRVARLAVERSAEPSPASAPARDVTPETSGVEPEPNPATERAALSEVLDRAATPANIAPADGALPLYLRPLEWLNSPLSSCPDSVLEVVGKVAIVTLVNAIAVLIYVLVFRRS